MRPLNLSRHQGLTTSAASGARSLAPHKNVRGARAATTCCFQVALDLPSAATFLVASLQSPTQKVLPHARPRCIFSPFTRPSKDRSPLAFVRRPIQANPTTPAMTRRRRRRPIPAYARTQASPNERQHVGGPWRPNGSGAKAPFSCQTPIGAGRVDRSIDQSFVSIRSTSGGKPTKSIHHVCAGRAPTPPSSPQVEVWSKAIILAGKTASC